jgi:hypothetical protein
VFGPISELLSDASRDTCIYDCEKEEVKNQNMNTEKPTYLVHYTTDILTARNGDVEV